MRDKQVWRNMVFSIIAFIVNYAINFWLTPYISNNLPGSYGYVKLANDFVTYAELITLALNSMAGRFISIEYNKGNVKKAESYFSSVLYANVGFVIILFIPAIAIITYLDALFVVTPDMVGQVRVLFGCSFSSFFIGIIFSVYALAAFIKNRLDYTYEINMFSSVIRALMLVTLFGLLDSRVYYVGIATLFLAVFKALMQYRIQRLLLPEIKIQYKLFDWKLVLQLLTSGIWNTIQRFGQILLDGIDTIVSNVFIGTVAMNNISFAKTMPGIIAALLNTMAGVFSPQYTILYAQNKSEELKTATKESMLFLSIVISVPVGIIMSLGKEFYVLWIPNEDANIIYILSCISCLVYIVSTPMNAVYNLFTVKNRVRYLALVTLGSGVISTACVFLLIKFTDLGVFAVAGCSAVIGIIRNLVFTAPYAAVMMGYPFYTFFPEIMKSIISVTFVFLISMIVKQNIIIETWGTLIFGCIIICIFSMLVNFIILLNKQQKDKLIYKIKERIGFR